MNESTVRDPQIEEPFWNPYVAGVVLGLVLLSAYLVMGFGLGASSALERLGICALHAVAPAATESHSYWGTFVGPGKNVLDEWLVYEVLGAFLGGLFSAYAAGRFRVGVQRGPNVPSNRRLAFAFLGGSIMGLGARFAHGCTSGQALTGGALLSVGSWAFMLMVFAGGYALAPFLRRQWQ